MSDFIKALNRHPVFLTNGPVSDTESFRRDPKFVYDPRLKGTGLIFDNYFRPKMADLYKEYITIAANAHFPIIIHAPTVYAHAIKNVKNAAQECVNFIKNITEQFSANIYVAGSISVKGDMYDPSIALPEEAAYSYHAPHAEAIAKTGVDLFGALTLPAASEAVGLARAIAITKVPYSLSFVIRSNGKLLDDTPLYQVIEHIDEHVDPKPAFYMINCVHTSIFEQAMQSIQLISKAAAERIYGLRANTSAKSPEELDGSKELITEPAAIFATNMYRLYKKFQLKILSGCCGTGPSHIQALAKLLSHKETYRH